MIKQNLIKDIGSSLMGKIRFISNRALIEKNCSEWTKIGEAEDGGEVHYLNPIDNSTWILIWPETEYHGENFRYYFESLNLIKLN